MHPPPLLNSTTVSLQSDETHFNAVNFYLMANVKIAPLMPSTDCVRSELNKAVSTDDLILLVMGLECMENVPHSSC